MAVRNLYNPQSKSWAQCVFNEVKANDVNVGVGDVINLNTGSVLSLQTVTGSPGDTVFKDGANEIAWGVKKNFGDFQQNDEDTTPFSDNTGAWVDTPLTFVYSNLPAGSYIIYFSVELQNASGAAHCRIYSPSIPAQYQIWTINGGIAQYTTLTGFYPVTFPSLSAIAFNIQIKSATPTQTTLIRNQTVLAYRTA